MKFNLLRVFSLIFLAVLVASDHASVTPESYWNSVLPNSPMPKALKDLINNDDRMEVVETKQPILSEVTPFDVTYSHAASKKQLKDNSKTPRFFLESNINPDTKMKLLFTKSSNPRAKFESRQVADSLPFSSHDLPKIYEKFSINPMSTEAYLMKETIKQCEAANMQGVEKYCATSLESMIDFSTTKLGKKVRAISKDANTKESIPSLQDYMIDGIKKLASNKTMICHKLNYPYVVFYCHKVANTRAYEISFMGADGTKVKNAAVCHSNTSKWNPKHLSFQLLKVKPGTVPICHFVTEDDILWVPYY